jgi:hypothetical protein
MTQNNDINNTNGAPKEYWEARAQNEREAAKMSALRRRIVTGYLLVVGVVILIVVLLIATI